jgi:hypothetical protein
MGSKKIARDKIKDKNIRADLKFDLFIKEIQNERVKKGKDTINNLKSTRRITLGLVRHPLIKDIKRDLINQELRNDIIV